MAVIRIDTYQRAWHLVGRVPLVVHVAFVKLGRVHQQSHLVFGEEGDDKRCLMLKDGRNRGNVPLECSSGAFELYVQ